MAAHGRYRNRRSRRPGRIYRYKTTPLGPYPPEYHSLHVTAVTPIYADVDGTWFKVQTDVGSWDDIVAPPTNFEVNVNGNRTFQPAGDAGLIDPDHPENDPGAFKVLIVDPIDWGEADSTWRILTQDDGSWNAGTNGETFKFVDVIQEGTSATPAESP